VIAHDPSKAKLWTDLLLIRAVADGQLSLALEIVDVDIIACPPGPLVIDEMFVPGCGGRVFGEVLERAFPSVARRISGDKSLAFHIGLASKYKDFQRLLHAREYIRMRVIGCLLAV